MTSIRKTKTGSGATAVQVVKYVNRKLVVLKHIGSANSQNELHALIESAERWINMTTSQVSLFPEMSSSTLALKKSSYTGVTHTFSYKILLDVASKIGFFKLESRLLLDLAVIRLIEPTSKSRSIKLLKQYFNIYHSERTVYRTLPKFKSQKSIVEKIAVACATTRLISNLSLVLYDVTTLYFETFNVDELRVPGFSKDNKSQQPQIVIGLLVTSDGFPLGYEIFKGNTFEGHTMIDVLEKFAKNNNVELPIVVADAAMISRTNVAKLEQRGLSYIVGARLANSKHKLIQIVSKTLNLQDGAITRMPTDHGDLICSFSAKRFRKDKNELERQIAKGKKLIAKNEPGRRAKFVKKIADENVYKLDEELITKTTILLGIKGYFTNIPEAKIPSNKIIDHYRNLWHVEQAFRMAKSDIATRPVFHHKLDAVHAHMVVCFIALTIGKYIEITTRKSLRNVIDILWQVTEAHIKDDTTGEEFVMQSKLEEEVRNLLTTLKIQSY